MSKIGYKALVEAAEARIRTISAAEAIDRQGGDALGVMVVDQSDSGDPAPDASRRRLITP